MKFCPTCGENKPNHAFYADLRTRDGRKIQCKACHTAGSIRTRDRDAARRRNRESMRKRRAENLDAHRERDRQASRRRQHDARSAARAALNAAVRDGTIARPDVCSGCHRERKVTGHHDDYAHPLAVRWLCYECHGAVHARPGPWRWAVVGFERVEDSP